jgi:hypothetical protein
MKVDLPVEQWNAIDQALQRNAELIALARANIAMQAQAHAAAEAKEAERVARRAARKKPAQ